MKVPKPIRHLLESVGKALADRGQSPELPLQTLPLLNRKIWGIQSKRLYVLGARTSQGKSSLALQIAWDLSLQKYQVLFLSLEMTNEEMIERLFCLSQRVNNLDLLMGKFSNYRNQWERFKEEVNSSPYLLLCDGMGKSWEDIDLLIQNLTPKPRVIILDYIQCIKASTIEKREVIDEYIRHFREMAIEHNFAAILCSQVNRASVETTSKEPSLNHLKGTGFLEEHADKVLLLHYPYFYDDTLNQNEYKLLVAKNRNGRTGYVDIRFKPEFYLFEDSIVPSSEINGEIRTALDSVNGQLVRSDWDN